MNFLIGCQSAKQSDSIDLNNEDVLSISDVFCEVSVIQLQSRPDIIISDIRRVKSYNGNFYIIDVLSQQIFCFDENGGFVFKISAQGNGPGEYNYITDIAIDRHNERLVVLDPVVQRILMFDLNGIYIETRNIDTGLVMGFNGVFSLNDSLILLTSNTYYQIVFYDHKNDKVVDRFFSYNVPGSLEAFSPGPNSIYQKEHRTFVLRALSRQVYEITNVEPTEHLKLCFGRDNNDDTQINKIEELISARQMRFSFPFQGVGPGKILNHYIQKFSENNRFIIAFLEFNNNFKHLVIDKQKNQSYSFVYFEEGVSLYFSSILEDCIIAWESPIPARWAGYDYPELNHRRFNYYNFESLSEEYKQIILQHNPMTDNPFLVVYKFKE